MANPDLRRLAADLEAARIGEIGARKAAAKVPAKGTAGRDTPALVKNAHEAYVAGRTREAWAAATVADAVLKAWGARNDAMLDVRARALLLLGFVEDDKGNKGTSDELRQATDQALSKMKDSSRARLAIAVTSAERALRRGRANDAVATMENLLRTHRLDDNQRGAAQAVLAGSLRLAGREAEGIAALEGTARSFASAGNARAVIEADLERGIHLMQGGDKGAARTLLLQIAEAAAAAEHHNAVSEAHYRIGLLSGEALDHQESARQFELSARAARAANDEARQLVALRKAGDELRLGGDLAGAERLLNQAIASKGRPGLEIDGAKAEMVMAAVRHRQGAREESARLLNDAERTIQRKLDSLEHDESPQLQADLRTQLRQVIAMRKEIAG